jgi:hypothetical protein
MSTPALYELNNLLGTLVVGRYPRWREQVDVAGDYDYAGAPSSASQGCYLENSPLTHLRVALRGDVSSRTAWVTELNHVPGQTYTVTVTANPVAYVSGGGDTWADVLAGLVLALPAVAPAAALVTFTAEDLDGDGTNDTLVIRGIAEADYDIDATATGAATVTIQADPTSADIRVFATQRGTIYGTSAAPSGWGLHQAATTLDYRGYLPAAYNSSGWGRAYVEGISVDGPVGDGATVVYDFAYLGWGPAVREDADA